MTAIQKAKIDWERANLALKKAQTANLATPTRSSRSALVTAADRWERTASAWSAAITADGNQDTERAEFVRATTLVDLTKGRRAKFRRGKWATFTPLSKAECDAIIEELSPGVRARAKKVSIGGGWAVAALGEEGRVAILLTTAEDSKTATA